MMKQIKNTALFLIGALLCFSTAAFAVTPWDAAYHSAPVSAVIDFKRDTLATAKLAQQELTAVATLKTEVQTLQNNLQTAVTTTFNNIISGAILDLDGKNNDNPNTFYGKSLIKVEDKKIIAKFKKLLMTYDSTKYDDISTINKNRKQFYMDNLLTINVTAQHLLDQLKGEIATKVALAKECAKGDGDACGIPASAEGGKNEVWFTYGVTLDQYDRLVKLWETVAALKARLAAVKALREIDPALATDSEKKEDKENDKAIEKDDNTGKNSAA